ncbi:protein-glutamate O-methyltransferase CheR [Chryseolinea sp. T2]|uniref:CheR family methyltransferase n=1 Tax=Chryseolinea sp. T2 TaxID=3129255 RepID=UPI0030788B50
MIGGTIGTPSTVRLNSAEFQRIRDFILEACGINLSPPKRVLVESRLQRRLAQLQISSFTGYCDYVMTPTGMREELVHMIDALTTNKTDFFREPVHFRFLQEEVLPAWQHSSTSRPFRVWSAACSSGEEPYTLAMLLSDWEQDYPFQFRITATDISTRVLEKAVLGIYPERSIADVPMPLRRKYLLRSKDKDNPTVRLVPSLRSRVLFKRLNLMDKLLDVESDFDAIFCRNVLIYFDRHTQMQVLNKLCQKLRSGGYLFIGHSESVHDMQLPLRQIQPTIFQRR